MKGELITPEISQRICSHMNRDHEDSIFKYVIHYGKIKDPLAVEMIEINTRSMKINVDGKIIELTFDHHLKDSDDAHKTLVEMLKSIPSIGNTSN